MKPSELTREFDAVCRQFHVEPAEIRYGRRRHRTARLATAARAVFLLRVKQLGGTVEQAAEMLELSVRHVRSWFREFKLRGLPADCKPVPTKASTELRQE